MFSERTLTIAVKLLGNDGVSSGYVSGDSDTASFIWQSAGDGEIQVAADGNAWWLRFDRTHAVDAEVELTAPEKATGAELAAWILEEAKRFGDLTA